MIIKDINELRNEDSNYYGNFEQIRRATAGAIWISLMLGMSKHVHGDRVGSFVWTLVEKPVGDVVKSSVKGQLYEH